MASKAAQLLAQGHAMLDFVLYPPTTRDTSGIAVNNTTLLKVKAWAKKQEDPITGDHVANASQVCTYDIFTSTRYEYRVIRIQKVRNMSCAPNFEF